MSERDHGHMTHEDGTHTPLTQEQAKALWEGIKRAEADPGGVPELPEWVTYGGVPESWMVMLPCGIVFWISDEFGPDDLDRIAEACRILAARERARRAGS